MKKFLIFLSTGFLTILIGCSETTSNDAQRPVTASGEELYQKSCITCHGEQLEGTMGPALSSIGNKYTQDEIRIIIEEGRGAMPQKLVTGEDAKTLAEWLSQKK